MASQVAYALCLELCLRKSAWWQHFDRAADLTVRSNAFGDAGGNQIGASVLRVLDAHNHHIQAVVLRLDDKFELIARVGFGAYGVLDLAGEELYPSQIDQVICSTGERTEGANVRATAAAGFMAQRGVVANQESQLRGTLRIQ